MRKLNIAFAIVTVAFVLAACSSPAGYSTATPYALKVAPKAITVSVPTSLVVPAAGAKSMSASRDFGVGGMGFFNNENRGSYHWVKESMWQAQKRLARAAVKLVLLDSIISANGLTPAAVGATPTHQEATTAHLWTEAEVGAFEAMIPPNFLGNSSFVTDAKLPKVGDRSNLPAFDYSAVDPVDPVNGAYSVKVVFTSSQSEDDSQASLQESTSYFWSSDKTRFKVAYEKEDVTVPATPVVKELQFVAFDSASSTLAAGRQGAEGSLSLTVKADSASTTDGVFLTFSSTINADKVSDYQGDSDINASGTTFALSAVGYADNAGGYVDETLVLTVGTSAPQTFYFKETFDASGKLVLAESATDSTFATLSPIANVTGEGTDGASLANAYDSKKTEVETERHNMDSSAVSSDVSKEEKHHAGDVQGSGFDLEFTVPSGQVAPVVGETWGVFSDSAASAQIGSGKVVEAGHLNVVFTATRDQVEALTALYLAKLNGAVADTSDVISVEFSH